jgi:hypothetical protein
MGEERREKMRLRPRITTFVALRPEFVKLGKLTDISSGGLCFEYITKEDGVTASDGLEIDMFISGNGYYLPNVPCNLVYDVKIKNGMTYTVGIMYRRCGLRFARLNETQMDQLEYYLIHHTTGQEDVRKGAPLEGRTTITDL